MSVALLVLLPILLSGYSYATTCDRVRFRVMRQEGHHLYFQIALYGISFLLLAFIVYLVAYCIVPSSVINAASSLKAVFDTKFHSSETSLVDLSLVAFLSILLAYITARLINAYRDQEQIFYEVIKEDDFELLLYQAMTKDKTISVTMGNRKVYVGWVISGNEPVDERKYLRLLPLASGMRNKKTGKVKFTTVYEQVTDAIDNPQDDGLPDHVDIEDFEIVLPLSEIRSSNLFDFEIYDNFQR